MNFYTILLVDDVFNHSNWSKKKEKEKELINEAEIVV